MAEQVRQLPCNHFFHGGCIVPWLELVSASHGVPRSPTRSPPGRPLSPRSARSTTRARCAGRASAARTPRGTPTAPRRAAAPTAKAGSGGRSDAASAAARRLRRRSAVRSPTAPRAAAPLRNTEPPGAAGGSEPRNGAGRWEGLGAECGRGGGRRLRGGGGGGGAEPRSPLRPFVGLRPRRWSVPGAVRVLRSVPGSVCVCGSVPGSVCALWVRLCPPLCALWGHPCPRVRPQVCLCPLGPSPVLSVPIGSIRPCPCLSVSVRPQLCVRPVSLHAPLGPPAVRAAPQPPRRAHTARSPQRRPAVLPAPRSAPLRSAPPFYSGAPSHPGPKGAPFVRPDGSARRRLAMMSNKGLSNDGRGAAAACGAPCRGGGTP